MRSGIQGRRIDFSDPQGGKGSCDRKAAQVKAHIKSYVNEDNSVTTPSELKTAIESRGGVPGVRVAVVETTNSKKSLNERTYKLEGVNTLNNFSFSDQGFYAFRAYDVGSGNFFLWNTLELRKYLDSGVRRKEIKLLYRADCWSPFARDFDLPQ